jgi:hypothetical protein
MSIGKLLVLVLGLAAIAFAAKFALTGTMTQDPAGASRPKRQLDDVRAKAKDLEKQQQKAIDDVVEKSNEQK